MAEALTMETPTSRLMKPTAKMAMRMLRNALGKVAQEEQMGYMELEDIYTNTRNSLAHLLASDRYRTHLEDKADELVRMTYEMLAHPDAPKLSSDPKWCDRMAKVTADLDKARIKDLQTWAVSREDVFLFLEVIDATREAYAAEECDGSDIISPMLYMLAHLVVTNFEAYDRTLNT